MSRLAGTFLPRCLLLLLSFSVSVSCSGGLRVVHASPDLGDVYALLNGAPLIPQYLYAGSSAPATGYASADAGSYDLLITNSTAGVVAVFLNVSFDLPDDSSYRTVVVAGSTKKATLSYFVVNDDDLSDQISDLSGSTAHAAVRLINAVHGGPAYTLSAALANGTQTPVTPAVQSGAATNYSLIAPGAYVWQVNGAEANDTVSAESVSTAVVFVTSDTGSLGLVLLQDYSLASNILVYSWDKTAAIISVCILAAVFIFAGLLALLPRMRAGYAPID